jgi:hypothetical protein
MILSATSELVPACHGLRLHDAGPEKNARAFFILIGGEIITRPNCYSENYLV